MNRRFASDFWASRNAVRGDAAQQHPCARLWTFDGGDAPGGDDAPAGGGSMSAEAERTDWAGRPVSLFLPEHYAASYPYPLIVWLHGGGGNERELLTAMPMISRRNYVGVSFRAKGMAENRRTDGYHWSSSDDDLVEFEAGLYETVCDLRREYHIHSERVFLAGFDEGATVALDLFLRQPERYGGAICLAGRFPQTRALSRFRDLRQRRVLIASGSRDATSTPTENIQAGRLLHSAGLSVSTRIVDAGHEVTRGMLRQIDHWIMDGICAASQA